jgi:hypothetical protein
MMRSPPSGRRGLFALAQQRDNLVAGAFRETEPRPSPPDGERPGALSRDDLIAV